MARAQRNTEVKLLGYRRRGRAALMMTTALQATVVIVLSHPAAAQPAANARPMGGVVTGGAAAISSSATTTTINQSTQRAAIDWQSFNVGSQQSVQFVQPSSTSLTLNRVVGPDPSQIAGKITANGQLIIQNQSGVTFFEGAQVNTTGLMVTAVGISSQNFMAGNMTFDQAAKPNAKVENRGTLTIRDAGLAALVAPQVANSGVINAKLGNVVLAGAQAATLDMYGDGLLSVNVTGQVTQLPDGATALVTNTGVIRAEGGTVQLTAKAADGIVQTLVSAGGKISARSVGDKTGTVSINGVGGSIEIEGQLSAVGAAPGTKGGAIELLATDSVILKPTAVVNASGKAGGGTVAIGTTLARAAGGPSVTPTQTAKNVVISNGASVSANATVSGNGGRVTVLSTQATDVTGTINAKGGPLGGNGGFVEVSGYQAFNLSGAVDVTAPAGTMGSILIDPTTLTVVSGTGSLDSKISNGGTLLSTVADKTGNTLKAGLLSGDILLQATQTLTVSTTLNGTGSVTLQAGGTVKVDSPVTAVNDLTINVGGTGGGPASFGTPSILINAALSSTTGSIILDSGAAGSVSVGAGMTAATAGKSVSITGGSGGITLATGANIASPTVILNAGSSGITMTGASVLGQAGGVVDLTTSGGGVNEGTSGIINAATLTSSGTIAGGATLLATTNNVTSIGALPVSGGDFQLNDSSVLAVSGALTAPAGNIYLETSAGGGITISTTGAVTAGSSKIASFQAASFTITGAGTVSGGTFEYALDTAGAMKIGATAGSAITSLSGITATQAVIGGVTVPGTGFTTTATSITTNGAFDAKTQALQLNSTGTIANGAASPLQNVTTLSGSGTAWTLTNSSNVIAATGSIVATDFRLFANAGAGVTLAGQIAASGSVTVQDGDISANAIALASTANIQGTDILFNTPGGIQLLGNAVLGKAGTTAGLTFQAAFGPITQTTTSTINTGSLVTAGAVGGFVTLLGTANAIGTLGAFTAVGLAVVNGSALSVDGAVTSLSGNAYLEALTGGISLKATGVVDAGTKLASFQAASLTNAGAITGGTFEFAPASASVLKIGTGGALVDLSGITATKAVLGGVTSPGGTFGTIATGITAVGGFDAKSLDLQLVSTGTVLASTNPLTKVGTLSGTDAAWALTNATNDIGKVGTVTATTGDVAISDATKMALTGTVSATKGNVFLESSNAGGIDFGAATLVRSKDGGTIGLQADTVTNLKANGTIQAGAATKGGVFELAPDTAGNAVTLGTTVAGALSLVDTTGITADTVRIGAVTVPGSGLTITAGTIDVPKPFDAGVGTVITLELDAAAVGGGTGAISVGAGGALNNVGTLAGSGTAWSLNSSINGIGALGDITATTFDLKDGVTPGLSLAGTLIASGTVDILTTNAAGSDITLQSAADIRGTHITLDAPDGGIQLLGNAVLGKTGTTTLVTFSNVAGDLTQTAASSINTGSLVAIGAIGAGATLLGTANAIGTLGAFAATNNIAVVNGAALTIDNTVKAASGNVYLEALAGGITLKAAGVVDAGTKLASFQAASLTNAGAIKGGTFEFAPASASVLKIGTGGSLAALTGITATTVELGGVTNPAGTFGTIATGITAVGTFNARSLDLQLFSTGTVLAAANPLIKVGTLSGTNAAWALTSGSNDITKLSTVTATTGDVTIRDSSALALTGTVSATKGNVFLESSNAGGIDFGAATLVKAAAGGTIGLQADTITNFKANGTIQAGTKGSGGVFELAPDTAGNAVTLGTLVAGALALEDTTHITADTVRIGAVTVPGTGFTITAGTIDVPKPFDASPGNVITLELDAAAIGASSGAVSIGAGGALQNVSTLTGSATSWQLLGGSNSIGALGPIAASTGDFDLRDTAVLSIAGTIAPTSGNVYLESSNPGGISIGTTGAVKVASGKLASFQGASFSIVSGGTVTGGTFEFAPDTKGVLKIGTGGDLASLVGVGTSKTVIGGVTDPITGFGTLATAITSVGIFDANNRDLQMVSTGAVTATNPIINVGTLTGTATAWSLSNASNGIKALGALTAATGDIAIRDTGTLAVSGVVSAPTGNIYLESANASGISVGATGAVKAGPSKLASFQAPTMSIAVGGTVTGGGFEYAPDTKSALKIGTGGALVSLARVGTTTAELGGVTDPVTGFGTIASSITTVGTFNANALPLQLFTTGAVAAGTNPLVNTGTLGGSATSWTLTSGSNDIAALGTVIATTGDVTIRDTSALALTGTVSATKGDVFLESSNAGGIDFGPLTSIQAKNGGTVGLQANAVTNLSLNGTVKAGAAGAGGVFEIAPDTTGNAVTLGTIVAGGLSLKDAGGITADTVRIGAVTIPGSGLTTTAGTIDVPKPFNVGAGVIATLDLETTTTGGGTGNISVAPAGALQNVGTLIGSGTNWSLDLATSTIATLGDITATGTFALLNGQALDVAGTVKATTSAALSLGAFALTIDPTGTVSAPTISLQADSIALKGVVTAGTTGAVSLQTVSGGVTEPGGTLVAGTLSAPTIGNAVLLNNSNTVGALGNVTVKAGDFTLFNTGTLAVNGVLSVSSANTVTLKAGGAITEGASGTIKAGDLAVTTTASGDVNLPNTGNVIGASTGISVNNGDLILVDNSSLILTGVYTANNLFIESRKPGGTIGVGNGGFGATLNAGSGKRITLVGDTMTESTASAISAPGGGTVELASFSNQQVSLGGVVPAAAGTLAADATLLSKINAGTGTVVVGEFHDIPNSGTVVAPTATGISLDGTVNFNSSGTAATLALFSSGAVTEPGGPLLVGTLTGTAPSWSLNNSANVIGALGSIGAPGGAILSAFTLFTSGTLNLTVPITATDININTGTLTANTNLTATNGLTLGAGAGGLTLGSSATLSGLTVDLSSGNGITQNAAGTITATKVLQSTLGVTTGNATLGSLNNNIGTLGSFKVTAGDFTLTDNGNTGVFTVAGPVSATNVSISDGTTGGINVTGSIGANLATGTLTLASGSGGIALGAGILSGATVDLSATGGGVSQGAAGTITATTLQSTLGVTTGNANLGSLNNNVGTLGTFKVASGDFTLADNGNGGVFTVAGPVSATNVSISDTKGNISVTGTVGASATIGSLTLASGAGGLALSTAVLSGATVDLSATGGGITQGATGTISATTLQSTAGVTGTANLGSLKNNVGTLGTFKVTSGDFILADNGNTGLLTVAGPVSATNVSISDGTTGGINVTGSIGANLATGTLTLASGSGGIALGAGILSGATVDLSATGGGVSQGAAGTITATTLQSTAGVTGTANLGSVSNNVGTLAGFAVSTGNFILADNGNVGPLTVAGPVTATNVTVTNATTGSINVTGSIGANLATGVLTLASGSGGIALTSTAILSGATIDLSATNGGITQSAAGTITATKLLQSSKGVTGTVALPGSKNAIAGLGAFAVTGGDFVLNDTGLLAVTNTVSAANIVLNAGTIGINTGGVLNATSFLDLSAGAGGITEAAGGTIIATTLTSKFGSAGPVSFGGANNAIATLDTFTVTGGGSFLLNDTPNLLINGPISAPRITVNDTATMTLGSGAQIITDGVPRPFGAIAQAALPPNSISSNGAYFSAAAFVQSGASTVTSLSGGSNIVRIDSTGPISFAPVGGLQGPSTWLILGLHGGGATTGNIVVGFFDITFFGTAGTASLTGSVGGLTGAAAAGAGFISPFGVPSLQLNNCPIHSVNCVLLPVQGAPPVNPLQDLQFAGVFNPDSDDANLLLPIVSDKDY